MAQSTLTRCDPQEVREVVENIYRGVITPAEGEEICLKSAEQLEDWARQLPPNLYNDSTSSALRRSSNLLLGIKENVHWKEEEMRVAMREVLIKRRSVRVVAKEVLIPRTSLRRYCNAAREILTRDCGEDATRADAISEVVEQLDISHPGRPGYMGEFEEKIISDLLAIKDTMGVPWNRVTLRAHLLAVFPMMEHNHDKHITLTHSYVDKLLSRLHKENLGLFKPTPISLARAAQSDPAKNKSMHDMLRARWKVDHEAGRLETVIPRGCQIFNMDEIGFSAEELKGLIIGSRLNETHGVITSHEKNLHRATVLLTTAADGTTPIPPLVIHEGAFITELNQSNLPPHWISTVSPKAYINAAIFLRWAKLFVKHCRSSLRMEDPVYLIMDPLTIHFAVDSLAYLKEKGISVFTIPAHTSGRLQPNDSGANSIFKGIARNEMAIWRGQHPRAAVDEADINNLVRLAWIGLQGNKEGIVRGWKKTGLFPFNSSEEQLQGAGLSLLTNAATSADPSELPALRNCDPALINFVKMTSIDPQKELARVLDHHKKRRVSFPLDRSQPMEITRKQIKKLRVVEKKRAQEKAERQERADKRKRTSEKKLHDQHLLFDMVRRRLLEAGALAHQLSLVNKLKVLELRALLLHHGHQPATIDRKSVV